jgi:hypothetical protein
MSCRVSGGIRAWTAKYIVLIICSIRAMRWSILASTRASTRALSLESISAPISAIVGGGTDAGPDAAETGRGQAPTLGPDGRVTGVISSMTERSGQRNAEWSVEPHPCTRHLMGLSQWIARWPALRQLQHSGCCDSGQFRRRWAESQHLLQSCSCLSTRFRHFGSCPRTRTLSRSCSADASAVNCTESRPGTRRTEIRPGHWSRTWSKNSSLDFQSERRHGPTTPLMVFTKPKFRFETMSLRCPAMAMKVVASVSDVKNSRAMKPVADEDMMATDLIGGSASCLALS